MESFEEWEEEEVKRGWVEQSYIKEKGTWVVGFECSPVIAEEGFSGPDFGRGFERDIPAVGKAGTVASGIAVHKSDTVGADRHN